LFLAAIMAQLSPVDGAPVVIVGRIFYIEGDLLRYIPEEKDWVTVVRDAPFGAADVLFSGSRGMAELIVPNGTWFRIGNSTQIQFIKLEDDLTETDVALGVSRLYNKSSHAIIKATCPFGYVIANPGTVVDFYVGDNSVEVAAVKGNVSFVHSSTMTKYDVAAGSPSILADQQQVSSGDETVDSDWDRWNTSRENFWASRVGGSSAEYLPPVLQDEAYDLDVNGRWELVFYEGRRCWFWRPTVVQSGWSPFTIGRWAEWYGDQTWIPAEPFGYITHHYGNWVLVGGYWYWAPPVEIVRAGLPLLDIGFSWYPGRVCWIHTGAHIGWVPLAPRETYYSRRYWRGRQAEVVNEGRSPRINIRNYAYAGRAIVVKKNDFYRVNDYRNIRLTNINRTAVINKYQAAAIVDDTVINRYTKIRDRFNYTSAKTNEKPHNNVINRIKQNEAGMHEGSKEKAADLQEQVKAIPNGRFSREARIKAPIITNYIVPIKEVNRPRSEIMLQQREIKTRGKPNRHDQTDQTVERETPKDRGQAERDVNKSRKPEKPDSAAKKITPIEKRREKPGIQEKRPADKQKEYIQPEKGLKKYREPKPPEKAQPEKIKNVKPPDRAGEKLKETKPADRYRESRTPDKRVEQQGAQKTWERRIEKPGEQRQVEQKTENPNKQSPSGKDQEKQVERKQPEQDKVKRRE